LSRRVAGHGNRGRQARTRSKKKGNFRWSTPEFVIVMIVKERSRARQGVQLKKSPGGEGQAPEIKKLRT